MMDETPKIPHPFKLFPGNFPLWFLALFAFGYLLKVAAGFFVWVTCAVFLFALFQPSVRYLKSKGISTFLSSFLLVISFSFLILLFLYLFFYFSKDLISELDESKKILAQQYGFVQNYISKFFQSFSALSGSAPVRDLITGRTIPKVQIVHSSPLAGVTGTSIMSGVGNAVALVTYFGLCPVLTLFMLNEKDRLSFSFQKLFESPEQAGLVWIEISQVVRGFFFGNLILFALCIPLFSLAFEYYSLPSVFILSILTSLLNLVPFLGAAVTGILPAILVLSLHENLSVALGLYTICFLIHFFVANLVTPQLLGSRLSLNATVSTLSLFAWGLLWGPMGILLAIPVTACLKILFKHSQSPILNWLAALFDHTHPMPLRRQVGPWRRWFWHRRHT
jgi:predicted PurR-regulated permease PerM